MSPPYDHFSILGNFLNTRYVSPGTWIKKILPQGLWTFGLNAILLRYSSDLEKCKYLICTTIFSIFKIFSKIRYVSSRTWKNEILPWDPWTFELNGILTRYPPDFQKCKCHLNTTIPPFWGVFQNFGMLLPGLGEMKTFPANY